MKIVWLQIEGEISQPWEKPTKTGTKVKVKRRSSNRDRGEKHKLAPGKASPETKSKSSRLKKKTKTRSRHHATDNTGDIPAAAPVVQQLVSFAEFSKRLTAKTSAPATGDTNSSSSEAQTATPVAEHVVATSAPVPAESVAEPATERNDDKAAAPTAEHNAEASADDADRATATPPAAPTAVAQTDTQATPSEESIGETARAEPAPTDNATVVKVPVEAEAAQVPAKAVSTGVEVPAVSTRVELAAVAATSTPAAEQSTRSRSASVRSSSSSSGDDDDDNNDNNDDNETDEADGAARAPMRPPVAVRRPSLASSSPLRRGKAATLGPATLGTSSQVVPTCDTAGPAELRAAVELLTGALNLDSVEAPRADPPPCWAACGVSGGLVHMCAAGHGGLDGVTAAIRARAAQCDLVMLLLRVRLASSYGEIEKLVLVEHVPSAVRGMRRARLTAHRAAVREIFGYHNLVLDVPDAADLHIDVFERLLRAHAIAK